ILKKSLVSIVGIHEMTAMLGMMLSACSYEKFAVYSCGSGFYFNRSDDRTYKIPDLDVESDGNYFYLEDYFCSDELGTEYKIKNGLFTVGSVYLAKKSDHYNAERYSFDVWEHNDNSIVITSEMNYVELTSSKPDEAANTYIHIEDRELPLDLTFNNVKICATSGTPVVFSAAFADINVILVGENDLSVGRQRFTLEQLVQHLQNEVISSQLKLYYDTMEEMNFAEDAITGKLDSQVVADHYRSKVTDLLIGVGESWVGILDGIGTVFNGIEGVAGLDGTTAFVHPCGVSIAGEGSATIQGGGGRDGSDASASLFGTADGGDGGDGGSGICCGSYLDTTGRVNLIGGGLGQGGEPSKGLLGSNGSRGNNGIEGVPAEIANPRNEK
ncbi:MAG: hypothetical protein J6R82_02295, partial [Clostridia bacterium]|nr:hypothetical protein [Clostridia bacterium]